VTTDSITQLSSDLTRSNHKGQESDLFLHADLQEILTADTEETTVFGSDFDANCSKNAYK